MRESADGMRGVWIALASYAFLVAFQLGAFLVTNVLILLAQALEMLSDVVVSAFLLASMYWSRKPADELHMFGHGRAQNVAALVAGTILILFMGTEVLREALPKFSETRAPVDSADATLALLVMGLSMGVVAIPLLALRRAAAEGGSAKAQRIQLLKDEIAFIPGIVGVILLAQGYAWADPLMSVIIGGIIVFTGLYLFRDNVHYLVGKSPGKRYLEDVAAEARSVAGVLDVHDVRAEYVGPGTVHAGLSITVASGTSIDDANRIEREVERRVSRKTGCQDCIVHIEPSVS